jgi:adenylate cyclase
MAGSHEHQADGQDIEALRTEEWRSLLTGENGALRSLRRLWGRVPSSPRCKVCAAPFHGPGKLATSILMHGQSRVNPLLCGLCFRSLAKHPGGAEIEISVLFADVRGSTRIAEKTTSAEFRRLLQRFYMLSASAVDGNGGIVDKFLGDGVMALFIPVIAGENHPARAIKAAQDILAALERSELPAQGVRAGIGVQTGTAFVGVLGSDDKLDFSALGDTVNVAARLGSVAGAGELVVSRAAWESAGLSVGDTESRAVDIVGREGKLDVVVTTFPRVTASAA